MKLTILPPDFTINPMSEMTLDQKIDDIKTYKENENCNIIKPTIFIINQLKDKINYAQPSSKFFQIDIKNHLNHWTIQPAKLQFNTLVEIIEYLNDKSKKFYLVKIVEHIGLSYNVFLYQIDNRQELRNSKIDEIIKDDTSL